MWVLLFMEIIKIKTLHFLAAEYYNKCTSGWKVSGVRLPFVSFIWRLWHTLYSRPPESIFRWQLVEYIAMVFSNVSWTCVSWQTFFRTWYPQLIHMRSFMNQVQNKRIFKKTKRLMIRYFLFSQSIFLLHFINFEVG